MLIKEIIKKTENRIKTHRLVLERMPGFLHGCWPPLFSLVNKQAETGLGWEWAYCCFKDNYMNLVFSEDIMVKLGEKIYKNELKNPGYYDGLIKNWEIINKKYNEFIKKVDNLELRKIKKDEFKSYYAEFIDLLIDVWAIPLTSNNISYYADNVWVTDIIKKHGQNGLKDLTVLSTPDEVSMMKKEEIELLKLGVELFKHRTDDAFLVEDGKFMQKLEKHASKYHWINNNYRDCIKLTANDFLGKIKDMKSPDKYLESIMKEERRIKREKKKLLQNNRFTKKELLQAELIAKATTLQDRRKKNNLLSIYYLFEFLKEVEKRTDYSFKELCYATGHEVKDILSGNEISHDIFESRLKYCVVLTEKGFEGVWGEEAKKIYDLFDKADDVKLDSKGCVKAKELKGIPASLGKKIGIVKIVSDVSKVKDGDFKDGNILVASMTRPEYTPLMRKAGAIVTNEGGISCHAAIVSRELGKPCVIGTKNATKVLKDGDKVEVDGDKGIVRIL